MLCKTLPSRHHTLEYFVWISKVFDILALVPGRPVDGPCVHVYGDYDMAWKLPEDKISRLSVCIMKYTTCMINALHWWVECCCHDPLFVLVLNHNLCVESYSVSVVKPIMFPVVFNRLLFSLFTKTCCVLCKMSISCVYFVCGAILLFSCKCVKVLWTFLCGIFGIQVVAFVCSVYYWATLPQ